eukprot:CAMPEP_0197387218 /NCGR_PEP_ID=MMETSP1165-20131217/397_1 /TAXON_ID=284809 /ORGANISM="Chrysocystis fragilis, Strain CCMP3189" /LENGTH=194 /DNA_ID=CAMNT_0042912531 /DNA_START=20 /DNA_END=601 /DNA_ORIENTATION=-
MRDLEMSVDVGRYDARGVDEPRGREDGSGRGSGSGGFDDEAVLAAASLHIDPDNGVAGEGGFDVATDGAMEADDDVPRRAEEEDALHVAPGADLVGVLAIAQPVPREEEPHEDDGKQESRHSHKSLPENNHHEETGRHGEDSGGVAELILRREVPGEVHRRPVGQEADGPVAQFLVEQVQVQVAHRASAPPGFF